MAPTATATATITLPCGLVVTFDAADAPLILQHKWRSLVQSGRTTYAVTNLPGESRTTGMHLLLMGEHVGFADHRDGNGLNNCRSNLRSATASQQRQNARKPRGNFTSRFKGVMRVKGRFVARIKHQGKARHLGSFGGDEVAAARAYDAAAIATFGEFARLNFPGGAT